MKIIKNNMGLIMFYICVTLVMMVWIQKVEKENDKMMYEKNAYVLTDYR